MVGSIMARTPRRSSSRPKIGVAIALRTKLIPNAVDSVPRPKPSSSVIGLMKRLALNNCMVPDENISATAEAPAIHHLFLNIALPPPFGDIAPKFTLVMSPWAVIRPTPIAFQSTHPESFRRETRSLHQSRKLRPNEIVVHARTQPAIGSR